MKDIPILILHWWNLSAEKFEPLQIEFRKRGYKVYCPDLPGFGKSEFPEKPLFLVDYVNFIKDFLSKNKLDKVIIIGHSFGGRISIKMTYKKPNLVQSLILTGAPGAMPIPKCKVVFFILLAKVGKEVFKLPFFKFFQDKARIFLYKIARASDYYNTDEKMQETFKNIVRENLEPSLSKINVPTLLLWGREDKIIPLWVAEKMNKLIKNSSLSIINDARHGAPWTHPKEFVNEVEKFLEKVKRAD